MENRPLSQILEPYLIQTLAKPLAGRMWPAEESEIDRVFKLLWGRESDVVCHIIR